MSERNVRNREKTQQLYQLIGRKSPLAIQCKYLLYRWVIKPIQVYELQLWGCTSRSSVANIQARQSVILRTMVNVYRYSRNDVHRDLNIPFVNEEIRMIAVAHENRMYQYVNVKTAHVTRHRTRCQPQTVTKLTSSH